MLSGALGVVGVASVKNVLSCFEILGCSSTLILNIGGATPLATLATPQGLRTLVLVLTN